MVNWKKVTMGGVVAGVAMAVIGWFVMMPLFQMMFPELMAEYEGCVFRPWDDPWMSYMFVHPLVIGLIMAFVFNLFQPFKKKSFIERGLYYGLAFWLLYSVPGMLVTMSSFMVSAEMVLSWTIEFLIEMPIAGIIIAKAAECKNV